MPTKRMLIDASHPEETRVVVVDGTRLEDYDVEVASRRQLKGNIYLAKVTRVEPSLQAAFVDYGGNRHGFLAFSEIHPDYYQIPVADRERLLAEEVALRDAEIAEAAEHEAAEAEAAEERAAEAAAEAADATGEAAEAGAAATATAAAEPEILEVGGGDDDDEIERRRPRQTHRSYKIQEVIKRRQIMLVQVAKEERGSKGAALTTYLSLAGRYCVLMPNTVRGGGISRKIGNLADRKRLKKILAELDVPDGMAVIVRTAGLGRNKAEIKRDYDYMMRLWSNIREVTLESTAPNLVYEEGNLIKRSLRDLYERDIEEILIQGEPEYKVAREFMKLFIPSHAKRVKLFTDPLQPLFPAYHVEDQLDAMHQPVVQLRSGGYIVINATEALISIDVNSGRSTRERHIEETALRTNLEAADEISRQLRLRDLAGLIVIDFIDMENTRNQGLVERRMKEAMKGDRARTQIGRISPFGLLELSRQRLRPSLLETSFEQCPHCLGMGVRRTTESTALAVLRKLEDEGQKQRASEVFVTMQPGVATYLLNQKRRSVAAIEERFGLSVFILPDPMLSAPEYRIERGRQVNGRDEDAAVEVAEEADETARTQEREEGGKRGRRRRGRRRRRDDEPVVAAVDAAEDEAEAEDGDEPVAGVDDEDDDIAADETAAEDGGTFAEADAAETDPAAEPRKRRRRGKRGGRRRSRRTNGDDAVDTIEIEAAEADADVEAEPGEEMAAGEATEFTEATEGADGASSAVATDAADAWEEAADGPEPDEMPAAADATGEVVVDIEEMDAVEREAGETTEPFAEPPAETAAEPAPVGDEPWYEPADEAADGAAAAEADDAPPPEDSRAEEGADDGADEQAVEEAAAVGLGGHGSDADPDADTDTASHHPARADELVAADADDSLRDPGAGVDAGEGENLGRQVEVHVVGHRPYGDPSHDGDDLADNDRPRRGWWQRLIT
ncbi:MAG: ribonuclease E/G [Rhodospirillales bacterium]